MSIRIDISRYELVPRTSTGPLGGRATRSGALLRWIAEDGNVGYSDCFPWPELGDENLETQLASLRAGTLTRLGGSLMEPEVLQAMAQAAAPQAGEPVKNLAPVRIAVSNVSSTSPRSSRISVLT